MILKGSLNSHSWQCNLTGNPSQDSFRIQDFFKKEKNEKAKIFDTFLYGLSQAQMVSGDKKKALKAVICLLTFFMR